MCSMEGEPPAEICPVTSHRFLREAPFQEAFRQHLRELPSSPSLFTAKWLFSYLPPTPQVSAVFPRTSSAPLNNVKAFLKKKKKTKSQRHWPQDPLLNARTSQHSIWKPGLGPSPSLNPALLLTPLPVLALFIHLLNQQLATLW